MRQHCTANFMNSLGKLASGNDSHQVTESTVSATSKCDLGNGVHFALKARVIPINSRLFLNIQLQSISLCLPSYHTVLHLYILDGACMQKMVW